MQFPLEPSLLRGHRLCKVSQQSFHLQWRKGLSILLVPCEKGSRVAVCQCLEYVHGIKSHTAQFEGFSLISLFSIISASCW